MMSHQTPFASPPAPTRSHNKKGGLCMYRDVERPNRETMAVTSNRRRKKEEQKKERKENAKSKKAKKSRSTRVDVTLHNSFRYFEYSSDFWIFGFWF